MAIKSWIEGYEGLYQIDTDGKIYSWKTGESKEVNPSKGRSGYLTVSLSDEKRWTERYYIHRLVWTTFKGEKLTPRQWITHLDRDTTNNKLTNLERFKKVGTKKNDVQPKYIVEDENGNKRYYSSLQTIQSNYGISHAKAKEGIKSGEWLDVHQRKNL